MKLDREQLIEYVKTSKHIKDFYCYAMKIGFLDIRYDYEIENLASYIDIAEVKNTKEIDALLKNNKEVLKQFISDIYRHKKTTGWRVHPGFLCQLALILKFPNLFTQNYLTENGWGEDESIIILKSASKFYSRIT